MTSSTDLFLHGRVVLTKVHHDLIKQILVVLVATACLHQVVQFCNHLFLKLDKRHKSVYLYYKPLALEMS